MRVSNFAPHLLLNIIHDRDRTESAKRSWSEPIGRLALRAKAGWSGVPGSLAVVAFTTIVAFLIEPVSNGSNLAILYMLVIMFSALRWSRRAGILTAVLGALSLDYFFVPPIRSFAVNDIWHLINLWGFLMLGLAVSLVTVAAKEDAALARQRERYSAALYSFTNALASVSKLDEILETVERHFGEIFQRPMVVAACDGDKLVVHVGSSKLSVEQDIISWVLARGEEAGCGSEAFPGSGICYRPVQSGQGVIGVIAFQAKESARPFPREQSELMGIFLNQTALAITRADLAKKAKRAEVLQEADKFQKALLNSVSHNLRTPLASILGVLNTILEDGALLDATTQEGLLKTAQDEAKRLEWVVRNLLDMTRLEGGAIKVRTEACDVHDIVAATLQQLGEAGHSHRISINVSPDLPLVPMDDVLIVQVLVNVLDNAVKYSTLDAPIEVQARVSADGLRIRVLDRGPGIAENELERVFDKFYRGSVPGAPKGAGLGLSICKGLVEAHHGQITAKRRDGGGTEITIVLPLKPPHA
jgi:two-component system, OmpR family, sensor histidine kinase KdpD